MAQRPSFDLTKLSTADKILLGGSLLLFIDTFLPWQKFICVPGACLTANAWQGNGSFVGVLMGLLTIVLIVVMVLSLAGVEMPPGISVSTVMAGVTAGTVVFGLLKFLFAVTHHGSYGAWLGLIFILAVAYGGYMKMQEASAVPPGSDSGFSP
jgi:hypothetical protein